MGAGAILASAYVTAERKNISLTELQMAEAFEALEESYLNLQGKPVFRTLTNKQCKDVVASFEPTPFRTADGWLNAWWGQRNGHWQSIVGTGALTKAGIGKAPVRTFKTVSERHDTPDGDFYDVEFTAEHFGSIEAEKAHKDTPIVVILHGLESNAKGPIVTKMAEAYLEQGFSCVLMNFRGCSGEPNRTAGAYHVGFTKDAHQITKFLKEKYPHRKIYLSGFSLGGNVSLKMLGELGTEATAKGIWGAVTMNCPYNAVGSGESIDAGINKYLYANYFVRTLKAKAEDQHKLFPGAFDIVKVRSATTLGDIDDHYVSKVYGFKDKMDYYITQGCAAWIPKIAVPAISISARDDPFIPGTTLPHPENDIGTAPVKLVYHDYGGHCGFVEKGDAGMGSDDRWIAREMAKAMKHIHQESSAMATGPLV